jgi:hypothetical protein
MEEGGALRWDELRVGDVLVFRLFDNHPQDGVYVLLEDPRSLKDGRRSVSLRLLCVPSGAVHEDLPCSGSVSKDIEVWRP